MIFNKFIAFATVAASAVSVGFASPTAVAHGAVATAHAAAVAPDAAVRSLRFYSNHQLTDLFPYIAEL